MPFMRKPSRRSPSMFDPELKIGTVLGYNSRIPQLREMGSFVIIDQNLSKIQGFFAENVIQERGLKMSFIYSKQSIEVLKFGQRGDERLSNPPTYS